MSYKDTLDYLYNQLPMYQRDGASAFKKNLDNIYRLCDELGNPQDRFPTIHIAGTNGKGSSAHMLASILQEAGYKTGLYTSPHLKDFTERIKIDGNPIPQEQVIKFVNQNKPLFEELAPSFFEMTVALAFHYFDQEKVDHAIIEVGLGGRLDSTNIIKPILSLITNINFDHQAFLGNTISAIAREKAGIIKTGVPVVIGEQQKDTMDVFLETARRKHAPIYFAPVHYRFESLGVQDNNQLFQNMSDGKSYYLDLMGEYQKFNLPGVFQAIDNLRELGLEIPDEIIRAGLKKVVNNTGLKGRWQVLEREPMIICDTGHNVEGVRQVVTQLSDLNAETLFIVLGMVNDKDIGEMLQLFPKKARYYYCTPEVPRGLEARKLALLAAKAGLIGEVIEDVNNAINTAKQIAGPRDVIFIGGSTFVVAEIEGL